VGETDEEATTDEATGSGSATDQRVALTKQTVSATILPTMNG
jgi:hypothetical protein